MFLSALRAKDVFRYAHLELTALPTKGTILVRGSNESGKTSIAEAICLALFGHSATIASDSLRRAIRWGQNSASIDMEFVVGETDRYRITRFFDDSGNHTATLSRVGQDAPLATGVDAVEQAIRRAVGFGYAEFLDTFYLAQGITETPSSRGQAVKVIIGLDAMERARAEIDAEMATEHRALADLGQRVTAINLQVMEVDYQEDRVARLVAEREQTEANLATTTQELTDTDDRSARLDQTRNRLRDVQQQVPITDVSTTYTEWQQYTETLSTALGRLGQVCVVSGTGTQPAAGDTLRRLNERLVGHLANFQSLRSEAERYRERLAAELGEGPALAREPSLRQRQVDVSEALARVSRRLAHGRAAAGTLSMAVLGIWGIWFVVGFAPHSGLASYVTALLDRYLPQWTSGMEPTQFLGLAVVSAAIAVLAAVLLVRTATLSSERSSLRERHRELAKRIEVARKQAEILDDLEGIPLPDALAALREIPDADLSRALAEFIQGPDNPLLDPQILTGLFEELSQALDQCDASLIAWHNEVRTQRDRLQSEISRLRDQRAAIESQLAGERAKQPEVEDLSRALADARHQTAQHERCISVLEVAKRLLAETASRALAKFDRALQHRLTAIIPQLTAGRYRYVQLAESQLRVFCPEKGDFADLAELSGGTRAEVALAVRLVLGEALEQSRGRGPQCMILDEPFGMFDAQRRANAMAMLHEMGDQQRQLWLIGHDIEGVGAMEIECPGDRDTLLASGT